MDNEKCKIVFDNGTGIYQSGQTMRGTISLICNKGKKIRCIYFKISGYGKCGWTQLLNRAASEMKTASDLSTPNQKLDAKDRGLKYVGEETYLNSTVNVIGAKTGNGFELPEGTHSYPFAFQLKHLLPSSFRGTYGKIKYKLEFVVDKPWQFDEKYEVPLVIVRSFDLNYDPFARVPQQKQTTRTVGIFGSGPVSLHVHIPRTGVIPGELIPLQVIVANYSSTAVDKVTFVLRKVIDYNSSAVPRHTKQEVLQMLKKEAGGVEPKKDQRYEHQLLIPDLQPSDTDASGIINIRYEILVEAKMHGLFNKDLCETIPLTVATIPLTDVSTPAVTTTTTTTPQPAAPGTSAYVPMPMPTSALYPAMPAYPSPPQFPSVYPPQPQYILAGDMPAPVDSQAPYPTYGTPQAPPRQHHGTASNCSTPRVAATAPPLDFTFASPTSTRNSVCSQQWDTPPTYSEVFGSPGHQSMASAAFDDSSSVASGNESSTAATTAGSHKHTAPPVATFS